MDHKKCTKCGEEKALTKFSPARAHSDGRHSQCRACRAEYERKYKIANPGKVKARQHKTDAKRQATDPEKVRARHRVSAARCRAADPEKVRAYHRQRKAERIKHDPQYRLAHLLRCRLNAALNGNQKSGSAVRDLGCSISELVTYLEAQFRPRMTWENHSMRGWHIDHIKPLSAFDLTDREQLLEAVHYTNLQPLWAEENLHKGTAVAYKPVDVGATVVVA